jgi:hypothetical protein
LRDLGENFPGLKALQPGATTPPRPVEPLVHPGKLIA